MAIDAPGGSSSGEAARPLDALPAAPPAADHRRAAPPTVDHRPAAPPSADHLRAAPPAADHRRAAPPTVDHRPAAPPSADHLRASPPSADHLPAAPPAADRRWTQGHFREKVWLTWGVLSVLLCGASYELHLDFAYVAQKLPFLLGIRLSPDGFIQGAALTIFVTACSMFFALLVALLTALGRLSRNPVAFAAATFYASLFRGTPLMVQVLIIYLALPQIGIVLGALSSGLIALSLNYGAYLAETIRSGMMAVPAGQREAAMALGLPPWVIAWKVTGPQALRLIIPPAGALFVSMLKDSSLVSLMGLWELNFLAQSYARATYHYMEMLIAAALIYWALSIVFELVQYRLERRFGRGVPVMGRHCR